MFQLVILEQEQEKLVTCLDSTRESVVYMKEYLQEKVYLTVDHLQEPKLQDMVYYT